jgi:hypothetical protein
MTGLSSGELEMQTRRCAVAGVCSRPRSRTGWCGVYFSVEIGSWQIQLDFPGGLPLRVSVAASPVSAVLTRLALPERVTRPLPGYDAQPFSWRVGWI